MEQMMEKMILKLMPETETTETLKVIVNTDE